MKKILISGLLICTLLTASLTACGKNDEDSSVSSAPGVSQQSQQQLPEIITAAPENGSQEGSAPKLPSLFSSSNEQPSPDPTETRPEMPDAATEEAIPEQPAVPTTAPAAQAATPAVPTVDPASSAAVPTTAAPVTPAVPAPEETITIYGGIEAPVSDFLFPYSSTQVLTDADLQYLLSLSAHDMHFEAQLAISEIYARYGYTFKQSKPTSDYVRARIEDKSWYQQVQAINPSQDQETLRWNYFNDTERKNVQILLDFQNTYDHYTS